MPTSSLTVQAGVLPGSLPPLSADVSGNKNKIIDVKDVEKNSGIVPFVLSTHFLRDKAIQHRDCILFRLHESSCIDTSYVLGNTEALALNNNTDARSIVESQIAIEKPARVSKKPPCQLKKMPISILAHIASFSTAMETASLIQATSAFAKRSTSQEMLHQRIHLAAEKELRNIALKNPLEFTVSGSTLTSADSVRSLDLSMLIISPDFIEHLVTYFPNLERLDFTQCTISDAAIAKLKPLKKLEDVNFSECRDLTGSTLDELPRTIKKLSLKYCSKITDSAVAKLEKMLLEELDLSATYITGSTLDKLSRMIKKLALEDCDSLTDATVAKLEGMLLDELNLYSATITGSTLDTLSRTIKKLSLSGCGSLIDGSIAKLEGMLLEELNLCMTGITGSTLDKLSRTIKKLILSDCKSLIDDGIAKLEGMLLEELDLSYTQIDGSTLDKLSRLIKSLDLCNCDELTDDNIAKLREMLLEKLDLSNTPIDGSTLDTLSRMIKDLCLGDCGELTDENLIKLKGMHLARLNLRYTNINGSTLAQIYSTIKKLDIDNCENITEKVRAQLKAQSKASSLIVSGLY